MPMKVDGTCSESWLKSVGVAVWRNVKSLLLANQSLSGKLPV